MKGQGKALELVLALFVLVIVVYILLQFFQNLFGEQTQQLSEVAVKENSRLKANEALEMCKQLCADVKKGGEQAVVEYCIGGGKNIDLNGNGIIDYAENSIFPAIKLAGMGTCEDYIPCSLIYPCDYNGKELTPKECLSYLCQYLYDRGLEGEKLEERVRQLMGPGECYDETMTYHWYSTYFPTGVACNASEG